MFSDFSFINLAAPLLGGALLGLAVSLMLLWNGRVTGISGITGGLLNLPKGDTSWRMSFILGLIFGGFVLKLINPSLFESIPETNSATLIFAGLAVGFGTLMGSGCTSGHGICGMSRLSPRSIIATLTFMTLGILTVTFFRFLTN